MQKLHLIHAEQGGSGFPAHQGAGQSTRPRRRGHTLMGAGSGTRTAPVPWSYNAILPQYQLAVYDRETGETSTRTSRHGSAFRPAISPDGQWLVFGTRHEAKTGLRLRNLNSGDESWLAVPGATRRPGVVGVARRAAEHGVHARLRRGGGQLRRQDLARAGGRQRSDRGAVHGRRRTRSGSRPSTFEYPVDDAAEFEVRQIRDAVPSPDGSQLAFTSLDRLYVMEWPDG